MGRPSIYSEELADLFCERLADGKRSERQICEDDDMPSRVTLRTWKLEKPDFFAKCAHAREEQAEVHHEEMDTIEARTLSGDLNPQAASVVLSNKRWRMEKLKAKVYGPAIKVDNTHEMGPNLLEKWVNLSGLDDTGKGGTK